MLFPEHTRVRGLSPFVPALAIAAPVQQASHAPPPNSAKWATPAMCPPRLRSLSSRRWSRRVRRSLYRARSQGPHDALCSRAPNRRAAAASSRPAAPCSVMRPMPVVVQRHADASRVAAGAQVCAPRRRCHAGDAEEGAAPLLRAVGCVRAASGAGAAAARALRSGARRRHIWALKKRAGHSRANASRSVGRRSRVSCGRSARPLVGVRRETRAARPAAPVSRAHAHGPLFGARVRTAHARRRAFAGDAERGAAARGAQVPARALQRRRPAASKRPD